MCVSPVFDVIQPGEVIPVDPGFLPVGFNVLCSAAAAARWPS
jgi:hypothetical protein